MTWIDSGDHTGLPSAFSPSAPRGVHMLASLSWMAIVIGAMPWEQGQLFTGRITTVDVGKAILTMLALTQLLLSQYRISVPARIPRATFWILGYVLLTLVSALLAPTNGASSILLSGRLAVLPVGGWLACRILGWRRLLILQLIVVAVVVGLAVIQALTMPARVWRGRLGGTFPATHPNDVALGAAVLTVACLLLSLARRRASLLVASITMMGILLWTQSRTGLVAAGVGVVVGVLLLKGLRVQVFGVMILLGALAVLTLDSGPISDWWIRDGNTRAISSLNSRTDAWTAALDQERPVASWVLGEGLVVKTVELDRDPNPTRVLDSTWVSALIQTGVLGACAIAIMLLAVLRGTWRLRTSVMRAVAVSLIAVLALRSLTESGLNEASLSFSILVVVSLMCSPRGVGHARS